MRKKSQNSSNDCSYEPFVVEVEYSRYFCDKLRRVINDEFEAFGGGAPTYLAQILKTVSDRGPKNIDVDVFSVKDFSNFLSGMKPWRVRLVILDIYIQITRPELRHTFVADRYIHSVGDVLGDYLESPALDKAQRELIIQRLIGVYKIRTNEEEYQEHRNKIDDRYFAIRRSESSRYLFCYEFSAIRKGMYSASNRENFKVIAGICIPGPNTSIILMRDFRYRNRHIGKITTVNNEYEGGHVTHRADAVAKITDPTFDGRFVQIRIVSTVSRDAAGHWVGDYRDAYEFDFVPNLHKEWINYAGARLIDHWELRRVNEAIDSFGNVF